MANKQSRIISGTVVHGNKMGHKIGFPTANLELDEPQAQIQLQPGIYACYSFLPDLDKRGLGMLKRIDQIFYEESLIGAPKAPSGSLNSFPYPGLLHYGTRSTFGDSKSYWEIYLLDFDYDIYDQKMITHIGEFIRPTAKFENVEKLIEEIKIDVVKVREILFE